LIEAAHAILRSRDALALWGKKLLRRKGQVKLVVAAMARKLAVAIWYLMKGRWTPLEEIDERLEIKVGKMLTGVGTAALKKLGKTRKALREEIHASLKAGRTYFLDPNLKLAAKA
jgi:hypothetical protein